MAQFAPTPSRSRPDADEHHPDTGDEVLSASRVSRVVSLTERRLADPDATIASLPADQRPLPTVTAYDELLARQRDPHTTADRCPEAGEES